MAAGPDSTSSSEIYGYFRAPPANQDFVFFEEMLPFQNVPEVLLPSTSFNISDPHESIPGIPLDAPQVYDWELLRVACSVSGLLSPPILPPQATTFPSPQTTTFPSQATVFSPPNWRKIPQKTYSYGLKQWNFTPLESILFSVNGRPGVNMGDALRKVFTGLDGRDDLVLQDASSAISCRLSFPGYPPNCSPQIPTTRWNKERDRITRSKLAHQVARKLERYLDSMTNSNSMDGSADKQWKIGEGSMHLDNMFLVQLKSVSQGSFQPEIWIVDSTM